MPPSQLKQLKASLRDHGLVGPQKSKKQKKAAAKDGGKRLQRNAALEGIRERFNPFEVKAPARPAKFEVTSNKPSKSGSGRPGVTKGLGEERRRETLLKAIQSRNKVGGILDRRFGENDPSMTPEQRAAERFARQNERKARKNSMFNLEDGDEEEMTLTHGGKVLGMGDFDMGDFNMGDFDMGKKEDFDDNEIESSDESIDYNAEDIDDRPRKRLRLDGENQTDGLAEAADQLPERKKSKAEVMKEVMAKSKLYKYERQQAKEDDDDLRAKLDNGMSGIYEAMRGFRRHPKLLPTPLITNGDTTMNPERAAMLAGKDPKAIEREYNERMRQMALDARSKPSTRTKTDEEMAAEEAARLQDLERKRLKRMQGEEESSEDEEEQPPMEADDEDQDDAEFFGISQPAAPVHREIDVEDEDDFVLDDDLIASDSEVEMASESGPDGSEKEESGAEDDGDDDFINGLVLPHTTANGNSGPTNGDSNLAYIYPCPQTHKELLVTLKGTRVPDLPVIVQRIRALYHPRLAEGNKEKLGKFAIALVKHVAYMADQEKQPDFSVIESLIRHLHSMAKTHPDAVGFGYRSQLRKIAERNSLALSNGDLMILTGISSTFPTSDHFHSVVTPAMLTIARYLGQKTIQSYHDLVVGAYCCTLTLQYQTLSMRYVPEVISYITNALAGLAPVPMSATVTGSPKWLVHMQVQRNSLCACPMNKKKDKAISFVSLYRDEDGPGASPWVLLLTFAQLLKDAANIWKTKSAFHDIFTTPMSVLTHILSKECIKKMPQETHSGILAISSSISTLQRTSLTTRTPLFLHNHRPLAIKVAVPKFEEGYNPDRHYDPDRSRADLAKLKAEHKRERKGAMRELRKDSNFIARESLREKKERDEAHQKRERRLIAEIQGEEGHGRNEYEVMKRKRRGDW